MDSTEEQFFRDVIKLLTSIEKRLLNVEKDMDTLSQCISPHYSRPSLRVIKQNEPGA